MIILNTIFNCSVNFNCLGSSDHPYEDYLVGSYIYLLWEDVVRAYSTQYEECVRSHSFSLIGLLERPFLALWGDDIKYNIRK